MFIKAKTFVGRCDLIELHEKVKDLIRAIDEQFSTPDKSYASNLIIKYSIMKLTRVNNGGSRKLAEGTKFSIFFFNLFYK